VALEFLDAGLEEASLRGGMLGRGQACCYESLDGAVPEDGVDVLGVCFRRRGYAEVDPGEYGKWKEKVHVQQGGK
jgi:hypothetical protein